MARIGGDSGRPHRPAFVRVGHRAVLIDLNALYPQTPPPQCTYHPDGLQIRKVATGVLTEWGLSEWGEWYGKVTYTLSARDRQESVTHWCPRGPCVPPMAPVGSGRTGDDAGPQQFTDRQRQGEIEPVAMSGYLASALPTRYFTVLRCRLRRVAVCR